MVVATGHFIGEGFDCPALDMLFLAGPVSSKEGVVQVRGASASTFFSARSAT
jgi:superfamily II DNA or RNA helicase